jgi:hypothetical protein
MSKRAEDLLGSIRTLEKELKEEIKRIKIETYEIRDRSIKFKDEVRAHHKSQLVRVFTYLRHARLRNIATAPMIWLCIFPALFMDLVVTLYQLTCFPVYGIPKVRRGDYIVMDRRYLGYLNIIEKANCLFCGYFNGLVGYVAEVGGRTEQYWCPIKHASRVKSQHSRYGRFTEFGDSDQFRANFNTIRTDFSDLAESDQTGTAQTKSDR